MSNRVVRQVYALRKRFTEKQIFNLQSIIEDEIKRRTEIDTNNAHPKT